MRSSRIVPLLLCLVMLSASIAGCLGSDEGSDKAPSPIDMIVYYEMTSGTIVEEIRRATKSLRMVLNCPLILLAQHLKMGK